MRNNKTTAIQIFCSDHILTKRANRPLDSEYPVLLWQYKINILKLFMKIIINWPWQS